MDLLYTDLNFNSVENLPGFEAHAAFTVNSASVSREDVDIVPNVVDEIVSLTFRGVVTIKCRSTCSRLSRKTSSASGSLHSRYLSGLQTLWLGRVSAYSQ